MKMKTFRFLHGDTSGCHVHLGEIRDTKSGEYFTFLYLRGGREQADQEKYEYGLFLCPKYLDLVIVGRETGQAVRVLEGILEGSSVGTLLLPAKTGTKNMDRIKAKAHRVIYLTSQDVRKEVTLCESISKGNALKESGLKESASKENALKESGLKECTSKENAKESGLKECVSKRNDLKESGLRESASEENGSKESGSMENDSRRNYSGECEFRRMYHVNAAGWDLFAKSYEEGSILVFHNLSYEEKTEAFNDCVMCVKALDNNKCCISDASPDGYGCALGCTLHQDFDVCKYHGGENIHLVTGTLLLAPYSDGDGREALLKDLEKLGNGISSIRFFGIPDVQNNGNLKPVLKEILADISQDKKTPDYKRYFIGLDEELEDETLAGICREGVYRSPVVLGENQAICCSGLLKYKE